MQSEGQAMSGGQQQARNAAVTALCGDQVDVAADTLAARHLEVVAGLMA